MSSHPLYIIVVVFLRFRPRGITRWSNGFFSTAGRRDSIAVRSTDAFLFSAVSFLLSAVESLGLVAFGLFPNHGQLGETKALRVV